MLLEKCPPETIALDPTLLAKLDQDKVEGLSKYHKNAKIRIHDSLIINYF